MAPPHKPCWLVALGASPTAPKLGPPYWSPPPKRQLGLFMPVPRMLMGFFLLVQSRQKLFLFQELRGFTAGASPKPWCIPGDVFWADLPPHSSCLTLYHEIVQRLRFPAA